MAPPSAVTRLKSSRVASATVGTQATRSWSTLLRTYLMQSPQGRHGPPTSMLSWRAMCLASRQTGPDGEPRGTSRSCASSVPTHCCQVRFPSVQVVEAGAMAELVPGGLVRWPSAPGSPIGVVLEIDGPRIKVRFDGVGESKVFNARAGARNGWNSPGWCGGRVPGRLASSMLRRQLCRPDGR